MEKQEIEEENILENEEGHSGELTAEEREGDRKCVRIREPTKPGNGGNVPLDAQRRKARLWRKKRILNEFQSRKCKLKGECINDTPGPRNIPKPRKEPLPMCKRALPESFWKEPVTMQTSSLPGSEYSRLPPLFSSDNNNGDMDISEIRPLTPPGEDSYEKRSKKTMNCVTSPADTELLFSLFEKFESKIDKRLIVRRGRPKKLPTDVKVYLQPPKKEEDPCMVDDLSEKLFPQLSLNGSQLTAVQRHSVIKLPRGGQTVELPAVQLEKHYPVMLDQLAMHL